jgi:hypothetical protein
MMAICFSLKPPTRQMQLGCSQVEQTQVPLKNAPIPESCAAEFDTIH